MISENAILPVEDDGFLSGQRVASGCYKGGIRPGPYYLINRNACIRMDELTQILENKKDASAASLM